MDVSRLHGRGAPRRFVGALGALHDPVRFPSWVPTLPALERHLLGSGHPFWQDADRALFVARRGNAVVGRIAAIENRAHNRRHGDRTGFFGFFDVADDADATVALLDAARTWLRERGLRSVRGPVSPSLNYVAGCLVEGFERPNAFLTPWNPPWYAAHLEAAGLETVQRLVGVWVPADHELPPRLVRVAEAARRRGGLRFRDGDLAEYDRQARLLHALYDEAWEGTWGFVPMSPPEFEGFAAAGRHVLVERFGFFAEAGEETVGFVLVVPDYNRVLAGAPWRRWTAVAVPRMLLARRRLRVGRIMLLGLRETYRGSRLLPLFIQELLRRAREYGAEGAEASWLLEGGLMHRALEGIGLPVTRRWSIFEGDVDEGPGRRAGPADLGGTRERKGT